MRYMTIPDRVVNEDMDRMNNLLIIDNADSNSSVVTRRDAIFCFIRAIECVVKHFNFTHTAKFLSWQPRLWMQLAIDRAERESEKTDVGEAKWIINFQMDPHMWR
jgi:hypothetical protein